MWAALQKTQASSARAGAAPGPGPLPATAGAAVFSDALPADASLPIHGAEGVLPLFCKAEMIHALTSIAVYVRQTVATVRIQLIPLYVLYFMVIRVQIETK